MRTAIILPALLMVASGCAATEPVSADAGPGRIEEVTSSPVLDSSPTSRSEAPTSSEDTIRPAAAELEMVDTAPVFAWSVEVVDETNRNTVASTWKPECPIALDDLRVVELSHWNLEGETVTGRLVIASDHVDAAVQVFGRLHESRFPIERMDPIDEFDGDDQASMAANNTSAFNCREISGSPGVWSQHAYGGAVDINPLVNPWVQNSRVDPPEGAPYADREQDVPGLIRAGDVVTQAFAAVGWGWGGDWNRSKDYQHFSWNGL